MTLRGGDCVCRLKCGRCVAVAAVAAASGSELSAAAGGWGRVARRSWRLYWGPRSSLILILPRQFWLGVGHSGVGDGEHSTLNTLAALGP